MNKPLRIGIIAGEVSGDRLGAELIHAIKKIHPHVIAEGIAGEWMQQAGVTSLFSLEKLSVMGIIEPLRHIPELLIMRRKLYRHFIKNKIDVFIGIDAPDFNLGLEIGLKRAGIKVIHYVSPSVWAWRQWRWHKIKRAVDLMLCLFPFEVEFYQRYHIPAIYVGHPLADEIPIENNAIQARIQLNLAENKKTIALLPGSRLGELKYLSDLFIAVAKACYQHNPHLQFVAPMAKSTCYDYFSQRVQTLAPDLPIILLEGQARVAMSAADVVLLACGTATLECALIKRPMIVAYKVSRFTAWLAARLVKIQYFALPNLLLKQPIVPELLQHEARVDTIVPQLMALLNDVETQKKLQHTFLTLHQQLKREASVVAAQAVLNIALNQSE
ncbi:MAG: lipid-A-disaccharide synthase [Legionellales bacterium]|nr:lipid-A-disaccharide synthase [Legionellales bacterium]